MQVNYVKQFNGFIARAATPPVLSEQSQCLYIHMFSQWNKNGFPAVLAINRDRLMFVSSIGSVETFYKSIKELKERGLIKYRRSKVEMIILYTEAENNKNSGSGNMDIPDAEKESSGSGTTNLPDPEHPVITNNKHVKNDFKTTKETLRPSYGEVISFFEMKQFTRQEAEAFWKTFENKDWCSGGKPIQNWKGFAWKYVSNIRNKNNNETNDRSEKDYSRE